MKRLLRVLDSSGDTRIEYDLDQPEALADAQRVFDTCKARGHSAFNVKPGSDDATKRISNFNESSEETILVPKIVGG